MLPGQKIQTLVNGRKTVATIDAFLYAGFHRCHDSKDQSIIVHESAMNPVNTIPARFSEENFKRFAPIIGEALARYPDIITPACGNLAVETYAARFRDALKAKAMLGYTHEAIDEDLWKERHKLLALGMRIGHVVIGPKHAVRIQSKQPGALNPPAALNDIIVTVTLASAATLCELVAKRSFAPMPSFHLVGLSPDEAMSIELRYDVRLQWDEEKQHHDVL